MTAKKVITVIVLFVTTVYLLFMFFDNLPWSMVICGLLAQAIHAIILTDFPYVKLMSVQFIGAVAMLFVNHYLAFSFFTQYYFNFAEVMWPNMACQHRQITMIFQCISNKKLFIHFQVLGYFTVCLWIVPFALFVSLNANDNVLPTVNERTALLSMSAYFSVYQFINFEIIDGEMFSCLVNDEIQINHCTLFSTQFAIFDNSNRQTNLRPNELSLIPVNAIDDLEINTFHNFYSIHFVCN